MTTDNLWGEFPERDQIESPTSILKTQSRILTEKTDYSLQGRVVSSSDGETMFAEFSIRAHSLNNFEIALVRITHDLFMYPVVLTDLLRTDEEPKDCLDADAFKQELSIILQSKRVKRVISSLLAQTNA